MTSSSVEVKAPATGHSMMPEHHSTVLDEIPHKAHAPNKSALLEAMEDVVFGSVRPLYTLAIESHSLTHRRSQA